MSRDPDRLAGPGAPISPEEEFLRTLILAQRRAHPTAAKMDALAERLGPLLDGPRGGRPLARGLVGWLSGPATKAIGLVAMVVALGEAAPTVSSPPVAVGVAPTPQATQAPPEHEPRASVPVAALPEAAPVAPIASVTPIASVVRSKCDEVSLVDEADAALRAGSPERALTIVRALETRCPSGVLVQERERVAIEALATLGKTERARARALAFEARFPASPHLRRVRQVVE